MKGWIKLTAVAVSATVLTTSGAADTIYQKITDAFPAVSEKLTETVETAEDLLSSATEQDRDHAAFRGGMQNQGGMQLRSGQQMRGGEMQKTQMRQERMDIPFEDNGKIQEMMPIPQGDLGNPQIDQNTLRETQQLGEQTQSDDYSYVYMLGEVSEEEYETFATYLDMVVAGDSALIETFEDSGWQIILTSADLDDLLFRGQTNGVEGCTYFNKHVIYVHAGEYSYCVIHELGHYLDYVCNYTSYSDTFAEIFEAEAANLTEYGQTSAQEFFAEVYSYSYLEPETLASNCPQALAYVEACLDSIS